VARPAVHWCSAELAADMTERAVDADMRAGQRKLRLSMIKT
jgi:hypothetical protein